ncbi:DNA polymerase III subunit gamma/tau [Candidatus Protochlamydia phocaeensis]|uniref:DNA polymerase III subunit gamma/tau n=1 Tax=Candidatus Protochlamydia phocaeensis TaxID=1414722 RepID=UPI000839630B|nr:DNA polymerase III subunit gamma/tau [Candidatus Protochlamydia phocaeensis]
MSDYQVIARKFRPQNFQEVIGQEAIVTTLKNAIKFNRLAQAYLFCGSRGTGKTTLARIFAKALNCQQLTADFEPCNQCSSCREITACSSLDVLEIDGASHRGIEDIRQINETVGYAAASGHYKIYIIDEVHMLTKEAFNALLKTLEEPPPKVKFFFATTEPHKVLPTILSRCQRFNLNRIPLHQIVTKLRLIAHRLGVEAEEEALQLLAQRAEGGLRDAESLFDQILAFEEGKVTVDSVNSILGLMPRQAYFELDQAGKDGHFAKAFEIAHCIFSEGKDLMHFVDGLIEHFRHILLIKLSGKDSSLLTLSQREREQYEASAQLYSQEQCLDMIDFLLESQNQIRFSSSGKIALEAILLHIMRSHFRLPIEVLVRRLSELEQAINEQADPSSPAPAPSASFQPASKPPVQAIPPTPAPIAAARPANPPIPSPLPKEPLPETKAENPSPSIPPKAPPPVASAKAQPAPAPIVKVPSLPPPPAPSLFDFVSEDPTPTPADLGFAPPKAPTPKPPAAKAAAPASVNQPAISNEEKDKKRPSHQYDTLFHFAAVELEGKLQRNV